MSDADATINIKVRSLFLSYLNCFHPPDLSFVPLLHIPNATAGPRLLLHLLKKKPGLGSTYAYVGPFGTRRGSRLQDQAQHEAQQAPGGVCEQGREGRRLYPVRHARLRYVYVHVVDAMVSLTRFATHRMCMYIGCTPT